MVDFLLQKAKLVGKHLTEWRIIIRGDSQAWKQLRINHRYAIEEVGLANFVAWSQQRQEVYKLGKVLALARMKLKECQQTEWEAMLVLFREA